MTTDKQVKLAAEFTRAMSNGDADKLGSLAAHARRESPFLYSLIGDTLHAASGKMGNNTEIEYLSKVLRARILSLTHWQQDDNETISLIESGQVDPDTIKPHVRAESAVYDQFYADQSKEIGAKLATVLPSESDVDYIEIDLNPNINHAFRRTHAIMLIETLFGLINRLPGRAGAIRWMDIACGTGGITNAVDPRRFGVREWKIVGCDLQVGKIAVANRRRARGRTFFASDVFQMLETFKKQGEPFDLVSMFEFLEHLEDPFRFIRQLDTFNPGFILAASPLEQHMQNPRNMKVARGHLWSFSRQGWERMFRLAGFEAVYTSEIRIGSYIGGFDWLTVICGPRNELKKSRRDLG